MIEVHMNDIEVRIYTFVGKMRYKWAREHGLRPIAGAPADEIWDIEGAGGEMAVAKALNCYWNPNVGDITAPDVGIFQVRTNCSRRLDDMILRPSDEKNRDKVFISVLCFAPVFQVLGWN